MHRSDDRDAHIDEGRFLATHIPGARFVEFPGQDHLWGTESPDAVVGRDRGARDRGWASSPSRTAYSRRCSSRTSSARRIAGGARGSRAGPSCSSGTTQSSGDSSRGSAAARSTPPATASSRASTGLRGRSAVRRDPRVVRELGLECAPGCTRANASCSTTRCAGSRCTRARELRRWPRPARCSSPRRCSDLVAGSGITFETRGEHDLKGVGARQIYAVAAG